MQIDTYEPEVERLDSIAIERAEFIATNLENYTSYEDEIKSSVKLKESSNFDADFKPDINCTAKFNISIGTDRKS